MSEESLQTDPLVRFVLGTASEVEQLRIEEECFTNPVRQQELWAVFDEVAERFWQGDLPPTEAQQFAIRLRSSPLLYERAKLVPAILGALPPPAAQPAVQSAPSFWSRWFGMPQWQVGLGATALLFVIMGVAWWKHTTPAPVSIARQETPVPRPTDNPSPPLPTLLPTPNTPPKTQVTPATKPSSSTATLATFFLMNKTMRDMDSAVLLPISLQTQTLVLQMEITPPLYPRYQATMQMSDGRTLTLPHLRSHLRQGRRLLTIQVPVATVTEEQFTVQIKGLPSQQEPVQVATHILQVQRQ